jgi:hypothetical protein
MTIFLVIIILYFTLFCAIDIVDLVQENNVSNWVHLVVNTGMVIFAAVQLVERF